MYPLTKTLAKTATRWTAASTSTPLTFRQGPVPAGQRLLVVTPNVDGKTQFLIKNPINRYLLNSPGWLPRWKPEPRDGLPPTLYVQKDSPGKNKESKLASRAPTAPLPGDGPVLSEDRDAVDPAARCRHLESAGADRSGGNSSGGRPDDFPQA